jgi:uncharacterized protein YqfA (UPF0365 family)
MIAAKGAKVPLTWKEATATDLAGMDPLAEITAAMKQEAEEHAVNCI